MRYAFLVIDMLKDYLHPEGKVYCAPCRDIIPRISSCLEFCRSHAIPVIYVNTALKPKDPLVKKWGMHAEVGSKLAEVVDELKPTEKDTIVTKRSYNGFHETELDSILSGRKITTVVCSGIHTHVCVLLTAVSAFEHGYDVVTLSDCMSTGYQPNHDTRLRFFVSHIGEIMTSEEWISRMGRSK